MTNIIPPIFIVEGGDVTGFFSAGDAVAWLEATDVLQGCYEAFDATGRKLELTASAREVFLRGDENAKRCVDQLSESLRLYMAAAGDRHPETENLAHLVEAFKVKHMMNGR